MSGKSTVNTLIESISDNLLLLLAGALGVAGIMESTGRGVSLPGLPISGELLVTMALVIGVAGYYAGDKIEGLLPEESGIFLVVFDDSELGGGEIHELNKDQWENLKVYGGRLHPWDKSPQRAYECVEYHEERNVAIAGWPETPPASATRAHHTVEDVMEFIRELRNDLEPAAAEARFLKRRMRGIIRRLDSEREDAQQALIDDTAVPNIGDSATIAEVIEDEIPEDLHPAMLSESKTEQIADSAGTDDPDTISFDVLDDGDALGQVATDGGDTNE